MEKVGKNNWPTLVSNEIVGFFKRYPSFTATLLVFMVMTFASDKFISINNIMNVLRQISMTAIMAAGLAFVIISGGIDIAISATVGMTNVLWVMLMINHGWPVIPAAIICLLVSLAAGALNGFLIAKIDVPPLIATYALQSSLRGLILIITDAYPIYEIPKSIAFIANAYLFGFIPVPVILMIAVFLVVGFVLRYTKFGRRSYACGGNKEAAHLSGIKVVRTRVFCYMLAHATAWFAGIILTSRLSAGLTNSGIGWEFEALSACIIGGISLTGGKGNALGALFGSIFVGILVNGMTLLGVNSYYQQMIKGVVLVFAIVIDIVFSRAAKKKG
jgi:ribose transport system permease protein